LLEGFQNGAQSNFKDLSVHHNNSNYRHNCLGVRSFGCMMIQANQSSLNIQLLNKLRILLDILKPLLRLLAHQPLNQIARLAG